MSACPGERGSSLRPRALQKFHAHPPVEENLPPVQYICYYTFVPGLRVYWEPIEIGGQKYDGAGGAQVPLCLIDHFLWASDRSDSIYKRYYEHTIQYVDDELRKLYEAHVHRPSLVTQICAKLSHGDQFTPMQKEAVLSVDRILATLIKFRHPHKKLACVTYDERYKSDPT